MLREFGSEFALIYETNYYFQFAFKSWENHIYLRSGREALGCVAESIKIENKAILIPAYCCDSMVMPFERRGWKIIYYKITEILTVDTIALSKLIDFYNPTAILVMNFFGYTPVNDTVEFVKKKKKDIIVIEDFTHILFNAASISEKSDYCIASIRKWFGISDGAILLTNKEIKAKVYSGTSTFCSLREHGLKLKRDYYQTAKKEYKEEYRSNFKEAENLLNNDDFIHSISESSHNILINLDCSEIINRRKANFSYIIEKLNKILGVKIPINAFESKTVSFSFPIIVDERDRIQSEFAESGLYAAVLWPIPNDAEKVCENAKMMSNKMLSIPIDQRYNSFDMEQIVEIISSIVK